MFKTLCQDGTDKVATCLEVGRQYARASKPAFIKQALFTYLRPKIFCNYYVKLLPTCEINEIIYKTFFFKDILYHFIPFPDYSQQIIQKVHKGLYDSHSTFAPSFFILFSLRAIHFTWEKRTCLNLSEIQGETRIEQWQQLVTHTR